MENNHSLSEEERVTYLKIFMVFLKIGALTFGGGYVMIPLIREELVIRRSWLKPREFYDIMALIQGLPGPLALNTAITAGKKLAGNKGSLLASAGVILPSFLLILLIAAYFMPLIQNTHHATAAFYGIRPAVTALIVTACINIGRDMLRGKAAFVILAALLVMGLWLHLHPLALLLIGGLSGWLHYKKKGEPS
ncbi:MAG: chromate transporter [Firmicutes bacterium]|nr:chromate transporter [Bacillota bacterium]